MSPAAQGKGPWSCLPGDRPVHSHTQTPKKGPGHSGPASDVAKAESPSAGWRSRDAEASNLETNLIFEDTFVGSVCL